MKIIKNSIFILLILFQISLFAQVPIQKVDSTINAYIQTRNIPAAQIAITKQGRLVYFKSYGYADKEAPEVANNNHRFRIGSISKTLTAIAIMKLIENGQLKIDQLVFGNGAVLGNIYGNNPYTTRQKKITIQHLLQHTAGWTNEDSQYIPTYDNTQLMNTLLDNLSVNYEPGDHYNYSNFGFHVLGRIIEQISGVSYESYMKNNFFIPYGINSMDISGEFYNERKPNEAKYYASYNSDPVYNDRTKMESAGWWIATAKDLVKLFNLIDDSDISPEYLKPETLALMRSSSPDNPGHGHGLMLGDGGEWWAHNGAMAGMQAWAGRLNSEFCYSFMINKGYSDYELGIMHNTILKILNDNTINWTSSNLFCPSTDAVPTSLNTTFVTSSNATLAWSHAGNGPFKVEFKKNGDLFYSSKGWTKNKSFLLKDLEPGTTYQWQVKTECSAAANRSFTTASEPYCRPTYINGCTGVYGITKMTIEGTGLNESSTCGSGGFSLYPFNSYNLGEGKTYNFSITKKSTNAASAAIWIDLNGNHILEAGEKLYNTTIAGTTEAINGSFTIPNGVTNQNSVRLRVILKDGVAPTDPCGFFTNGETEDFVVNIQQCSLNPTPTNLRMSGVQAREATLLWSQVGVGPYLVEYQRSGFPFWYSAGWVTEKSKRITSLIPNETYFWRVKSACSVYALDTFTTALDYCDAKFLIAGCSNIGITKVKILNTELENNSSCSPNGYSLNSNTWLDLFGGSRYILQIEKSASTTPSKAAAWLDFNGNKQFESNELLYAWTVEDTLRNRYLSFDIPNIEKDIFNTRLRVMVKTGDIPLDGCGTFLSPGEAEDYNLNILSNYLNDFIFRPPSPGANQLDQARKGIYLGPGTIIESQNVGTYTGKIVPYQN